jgi:putative heme-binding domain-containing protein
MDLRRRSLCVVGIGLTFFVAVTAAAPGAELSDLLVAKTPPLSPQEEGQKFHLPPGFRIDLVASEPDIVKPINMKFDSAGRLYVTQSFEYPFAVPEGHLGRDTIRLILDKNKDGVPETVSIFADGLSIPIGLTPIPDGVFGYSIPYLYRFYDRNHNGASESREIAYRGFGHHDTHGMVNGLNYWLDGWIYCCHGFSNTSTIKGTDGSTITMNSGNTFRCRIDGSRVEQISFGQVNPFGMAFDERGDMYTADCHTRPATLVLRDGCYQSFGKPHDGLGFAPELMRHDHGSTGIGAVVVYADDKFPESERGTLFLGNPVTGRINHDRIETKGSTHRAIELPDFLTCDDPWFRPVDLQLAADGSIYVADFYNCIIGHYEVPLTHPLRDRSRGRIWRISHTGNGGAGANGAPDLSRASVEDLLSALSNSNLAVRTFTTHELVNRIGKPAIKPVHDLLLSAARPEARAHAVWVLFRLGAFDQDLIQRLADDPAALVRLHLVKAVAEQVAWDEWQRSLISGKRIDADPFVRRAAAEALGRHPDLINIEPLVELWRTADPADTMLIHTTRIALRNTLRPQADLQQVVQRFQSSTEVRRRVVDVAPGIPTRAAAEMVLELLRRDPDVTPNPAASLEYIAKTIDIQRIPDAQRLAFAYRGRQGDVGRAMLLVVFRTSRERGVAIPAEISEWASSVAGGLLNSKESEAVRRGIELATEMRSRSQSERLAAIVSGSRFAPLRGTAANALVLTDAKAALPVIEAAVRNPQTPIKVRCDLVEPLRGIPNSDCRAFLVDLLKVAPARLTASIVDTLARSRDGAVALVDAAEKGHCSLRLLGDPALRGRLQAIGVPHMNARIAKLLEGLPTADERAGKTVAQFASRFSKTDSHADLGSAVFQKNCAACHQVAGKGNRVGPTLDGVGNRGVERILEDLFDPNRNVDVTFRSSILALNDGQIVSGLIVREEGQILVLADSKGKEQRIPVDKVEQRTQSKLSPMPTNLSEQMSPQEICDLVAFLLRQRAPGEAHR